MKKNEEWRHTALVSSWSVVYEWGLLQSIDYEMFVSKIINNKNATSIRRTRRIQLDDLQHLCFICRLKFGIGENNENMNKVGHLKNCRLEKTRPYTLRDYE